MGNVIDGKALSLVVKDEVKAQVIKLEAKYGRKMEVALESVRAAKETGADAVKIQTYTADTITLNCDADDFKVKGTLWDGRHSI